MYKTKKNKRRINITIDCEMHERLRTLAFVRKSSVSAEIVKVIEYAKGISFYGAKELSVIEKLNKHL